MAGKLGQSERVAEFKTPLGENVLALINLEGTEALGELFEFHIEALSEQENIDFDKALGQGCTLKLKAYEGKERIFHGIMTEAQWIGKLEDFHHYKVVLRPWLWMLGRRADCRIFLDKDVKDIIKDVFSKQQKSQMISKLTDSMVSIEGENMRGVTWCVIEEVESGDWGIGGNALTTADVHALAQGKAA